MYQKYLLSCEIHIIPKYVSVNHWKYLCETEVEWEVGGADIVRGAEDVLRVGVAAPIELGRENGAPGGEILNVHLAYELFKYGLKYGPVLMSKSQKLGTSFG